MVTKRAASKAELLGPKWVAPKVEKLEHTKVVQLAESLVGKKELRLAVMKAGQRVACWVRWRAVLTADESAERKASCSVASLVQRTVEALVGLKAPMSAAQKAVWRAGLTAEWTAEPWDLMKADKWVERLGEWMAASTVEQWAG